MIQFHRHQHFKVSTKLLIEHILCHPMGNDHLVKNYFVKSHKVDRKLLMASLRRKSKYHFVKNHLVENMMENNKP